MFSYRTLADLENITEEYALNRISQERLKERKVLPIMATPLLANFCGHLIGDGSIKFTNRDQGAIRFYGTVPKLLILAKIYKFLFNKKISLTKRTRPNEKGYKIDVTDTSIVRILKYIGVPIGDKAVSSFEIPEWILNGEKEIKRAFLQALCDDELEGLQKEKSKPNTWKGLKFKMSKKKELLQQHINFLEQIRKLLGDFGIETTDIKVAYNDSFNRKDGNITYPAYFRIKIRKRNREKFFNEVGFQMDLRKREKLIKSLI